MIGRTIAHYSITARLGKGGMGEVFRATDTKLKREVALKILPQGFTRDPQRLARFQREAEVLASLNHSNIGAIYGLEESDSSQVLVLELIEGEDLSERISRGPIPEQEALQFAFQIAEALEAAHAKGIIHRDLKPANVKITPEGQVKVLDFGLAKALEEEKPPQEMADSPTLTMQATQAGIILGTAAYMSPEQARGKPADSRSDIWSLGVVLFEMLTGRKAFEGDDLTLTLAAVVREEPSWQILPKEVSPLRRVLARCLAKDPRQRYHHVADVRLALEDYLSDPWPSETYQETAPVASRPSWQFRLASGAAILLALLALFLWRPWQEPRQPPQPKRMTLQTPVDLSSGYGASVVLSPDERLIVYATSEPALYLRRFGQLEGVRLSGTEGARNPFFSPDGQWIAFATDDALKKVSIDGGVPLTLCALRAPRGGTWGDDGTIVFAPGNRESLYRISDVGSAPEAITTLEEGERAHRWPDFLPGARALLMNVLSGGSSPENRIEVLTLADGERKVLYRGGYSARYVPTGHLVFLQDGTLFAAPFDPDSLELRGQPAPVLPGVLGNSANRGNGHFAFSRQGSLIYEPARQSRARQSLVWVDRKGTITAWNTEAADYGHINLSPDGERLAMEVSDAVWIQDLVRGERSRLTFSDDRDFRPLWSADGNEILFTSRRDGRQPAIYRRRADGTGEAERLTESDNPQWTDSISGDGRYLVFQESARTFDLWTLDLETGAEPEIFLQTEFDETRGAFSPDGRWMAYASNESGREEVYVRPFPKGSGKWQISNQGGNNPVWSSAGNELFYFWQNTMYAVSYQSGTQAFRAQSAEPLFSGTFAPRFDVAPDGERFVMLQSEETAESGRSEVILILNWFEELKRLVPTGN